MSDVSLQLVREFFELNNFTVLMKRKHQLQKYDPEGEQNIELLITNLSATDAPETDQLVLDLESLATLRRGIVDVKGWHTEIFYPSLLERDALYSFVRRETLEYAGRAFGSDQFSKIMVLSELPKSGPMRARSEKVLKEKGVDHVLEFRFILRTLVSRAHVNNNYTESDTLQMLRLVKRYGLIRESQMEFDFP